MNRFNYYWQSQNKLWYEGSCRKWFTLCNKIFSVLVLEICHVAFWKCCKMHDDKWWYMYTFLKKIFGVMSYGGKVLQTLQLLLRTMQILVSKVVIKISFASDKSLWLTERLFNWQRSENLAASFFELALMWPLLWVG